MFKRNKQLSEEFLLIIVNYFITIRTAIPFLSEDDKCFSNYNYGSHFSETKDCTQNQSGGTEINTAISFKYPKAVIFLLCSKFFESFAANGIRTVLALYLRDSLNYTEEFATSILHVFNFFGQFCPIFGAVIADSYLGNAKTIFYFLFLYATGWIGLILITFPLGSIPFVPLLFLSLLFISVGNGSIRACITSLGGNQFQLPEQTKSLNTYFSQYYFMYTMGILLSKLVPPAIRADTQCFGKPECYSAVFGALGTVFLACWVVFLSGMFFYKQEEPGEGNILIQVVGCIWHGLIAKIKNKKSKSKKLDSWIDGSIGRYSESFVRDVLAYLNVIKLFIPLPIYWALLAQQDSTWTFQATQLNTRVFGVQIEADQAKALGPILLLLIIPIWQKLLVPLLHRANIQIPPLHSVAMGGICAALSFVCAGALQWKIESQMDVKFCILWQIPQFFLLMMGEVLLSIPGLLFSFTQAPQSMKSVLTASWFCNNAIGNLIVVLITEIQPFKLQSTEFFLYAILMFMAIVLFVLIAAKYKEPSKSGGSMNGEGHIESIGENDKFMFLPIEINVEPEKV